MGHYRQQLANAIAGTPFRFDHTTIKRLTVQSEQVDSIHAYGDTFGSFGALIPTWYPNRFDTAALLRVLWLNRRLYRAGAMLRR